MLVFSQEIRKQEWTAIIPNSQLIVIPYPHDKPRRYAWTQHSQTTHYMCVIGGYLWRQICAIWFQIWISKSDFFFFLPSNSDFEFQNHLISSMRFYVWQFFFSQWWYQFSINYSCKETDSSSRWPVSSGVIFRWKFWEVRGRSLIIWNSPSPFMDEFASQNVSKCSSLRERGTLRTASNVRSARMELIQPHSKSCSVPSSEQAPMGWTIERFFFFTLNLFYQKCQK